MNKTDDAYHYMSNEIIYENMLQVATLSTTCFTAFELKCLGLIYIYILWKKYAKHLMFYTPASSCLITEFVCKSMLHLIQMRTCEL